MPLLKCSASKAKPKNGIAYITDEKKAKIVSVARLDESVPDYVLISSAAKKKILDELSFFGVCGSVLLPEKDKIEKYAHILEEVKKGTKVL